MHRELSACYWDVCARFIAFLLDIDCCFLLGGSFEILYYGWAELYRFFCSGRFSIKASKRFCTECQRIDPEAIRRIHVRR